MGTNSITLERLRRDWMQRGVPDPEYAFRLATSDDLDMSLAQFQEKFEPIARLGIHARLLYEVALAASAYASARAKLDAFQGQLCAPDLIFAGMDTGGVTDRMREYAEALRAARNMPGRSES